MIAKTNVQMRVGACPGLRWAQKSRTLLSKSIFFLLTIPESVLGMVLGEFVLEGWLKDIAAKAVVLPIETVRNASCYGWEMAIPGPRTPLVARIRGGSGPLATPCTVPRGSRRIELETPPHAVPAVRTVHLDGGRRMLLRSTKSVPPKK